MKPCLRDVALVAAVCWAAPAANLSAQVLERPPRPFRGLFGGRQAIDPSRSRQELTLNASLLGGYDDNLTPEGSGIVGRLRPRESGYNGFADIGLRYWRGRARRSFAVTGRGYFQSYWGVIASSGAGGDGSAELITSVGRRSNVTLTQTAASSPFFALGGFDPLREVDGVPPLDASPANALTTHRSWRSVSSGLLEHRWSRDSRTTLGYSFQHTDYAEDVGFDTTTHAASLEYGHTLSRASSLSSSYRYSDSSLQDAGGNRRPVIQHSVDAGYGYRKSLSSTKQFHVSAAVGVTYVDTVSSVARVPRRFWAPSGQGSVRMEFARTWSIAADYRRSLSVLDGISPESFFTDAVMLRGGGLVTSRLELVFTAAYADGHAGEGANDLGRYETYSAGAQLGLALARWCSTTVNYQRYDYRLRGLELPSAFASELSRNALRVGFTFWLPLYGAYTDRADGSSGR